MMPEPKAHASGEGKILLGEALSAVREEIRDTKTGLAKTLVGSVLPRGMLESTKFRPRHSRAR